MKFRAFATEKPVTKVPVVEWDAWGPLRRSSVPSSVAITASKAHDSMSHFRCAMKTSFPTPATNLKNLIGLVEKNVDCFPVQTHIHTMLRAQQLCWEIAP